MTENHYKTRAFTLIELITVIGIIAIMVGISFPTIRAMVESSSSSMGVNAVSKAAQVAHAYAVFPTKFNMDLQQTSTNVDDHGVYRGAAALVTPANQIRIIKNIPWARYSGFGLNPSDGINYFPLQLHGPTISATAITGPSSDTDSLLRRLNGFANVEIDPIQLNADTGVCGIIRNHNLTRAWLIPPPFAIWYDQEGVLITSNLTPAHNADYSYVYYDGSADTPAGNWDVNSGRTSSYNPYEYDPEDATFLDNATVWNNETGTYYLPFERIEAVIGVITYSKSEFIDAVDDDPSLSWDNQVAYGDATDTVNDARWEWMEKNGSVILFSKQSGNQMRSAAE
ncbi:pilus assembly FimT family protein [Poriferisphaera sp. WC338]|uniref:pilus assembly FimT family protein n=1 Tax=Poriferisphaera sp. WC338 TaxID=3425129 RepID=UPI003D814749